MATHEKLVQIPNEFKDLPLEAKPKIILNIIF